MIHTTPLPGDIGLIAIKGFVGKLIRVGQFLNGDGFSDYEHAFVVLEDGTLIEGQPGGAIIRPIAAYDDRYIKYVCPDGLVDLQRAAICLAARSLEGTPYSFVDYAAIGAHRAHLPIPGLQAYVEDTGHLICSQLAFAAYDMAGAPLLPGKRWAGYVTPGGIDKALG